METPQGRRVFHLYTQLKEDQGGKQGAMASDTALHARCRHSHESVIVVVCFSFDHDRLLLLACRSSLPP
eukprot:768808-Hanusia_phi.AAC.5